MWLSGSSSKGEVPALLSYHEEAEICLILNVKDAIQNKHKRVIAICRESGVLLPGQFLYHLVEQMMSGTSKKKI